MLNVDRGVLRVILWANVRCPYCGKDQRAHTEKQLDRQLVTCDLDEGGCDREFVVHLGAILQVRGVYRLQEVQHG